MIEIISKNQVSAAAALDKFKVSFLSPWLMQVLQIKSLNELYASAHTLDGFTFVEEILKRLSIQVEIHPQDLQHIPATGAFIAVANHPYGALDGLLMLKLLGTARPDFKLMANHLLQQVPNLLDVLLPVNAMQDTKKSSFSGVRTALRQLHNDMPVGIFPAGEVSSFHWQTSAVSDPAWHPSVGKLVQLAKVPVLPVYFSGHNGLTFSLAGLLHPLLRTAQLPAQLLNKQGQKVLVRIGKPIYGKEIQALSPTQLLPYLRAKTYALGACLRDEEKEILQRLSSTVQPAPVVAETDQELLYQEISNLRPSAKLVQYKHLEVYMAVQQEVPHVVNEIGRLRELTFRAAGEGTNLAIDLDEYDRYYHHLFLYDQKARKLVGAYRLGKGKFILKKFGKKGFYLHSLFKMKKGFVPTLKNSLELGRAFVRQEYQRQPLPLLLLWKGIATYLENKLSYRYLIGSVSISDQFSSMSKMLMVDFITTHYYDLELAALVQARKKFRYRFSKEHYETVLNQNVSSIDSLEKLVSYLDPKQRTLPVLLKKYLQQNARIIGFNIDPKFSNSLDGFMVMDVTTLPATTARLLERYTSSNSEETLG
ncbi:GNAT family N-acetyltransferase [Pontibacter qinzhouensis]|uniref:GNAT family N-acetyltransferase n=1 Tax=Pontibacter qinzhouensis TaxID=2603253 RepID=A0A5C8KD20_9BACT|nr:GNAT family N-acyltransferase [Pontibacter qinzhouensis]TXK52182.1 GNAT family N-acetyltransferase [Pontibacter qinzhouensis]